MKKTDYIDSSNDFKLNSRCVLLSFIRVVRHTDICINNEGVNDKFRIQVTEHGTRKVLGMQIQTFLLTLFPPQTKFCCFCVFLVVFLQPSIEESTN